MSPERIQLLKQIASGHIVCAVTPAAAQVMLNRCTPEDLTRSREADINTDSRGNIYYVLTEHTQALPLTAITENIQSYTLAHHCTPTTALLYISRIRQGGLRRYCLRPDHALSPTHAIGLQLVDWPTYILDEADMKQTLAGRTTQ